MRPAIPVHTWKLILLVLVVSATCGAPFAAAEDAGAAVLRAGRVDFDGEFRAEARAVGYATDSVTVRVVAAHARVEVVSYEVIGLPRGEYTLAQERHVVDIAPVNLTVAPVGSVGSLAAYGDRAVLDAADLRIRVVEAFQRHYFHQDHEVLEYAGDLSLERVPKADFPHLVLYGRNVSVQGDANFDVTQFERSMPVTGNRVENRSILRIDFTDARLVPVGSPSGSAADASPTLRLTATALDATGEGRVRFLNAAGWVAEGAAKSTPGDDVTLAGTLDLAVERSGARTASVLNEAHSPAPAPRWSVSGTFRTVQVGDDVLVSEPAAWALAGVVTVLAALALYSRIRDDAVLRHETRRRILAAVRARPGRAIEDVQRELDLAASTFRYHVEILRARRFLRTEREGRRVLLFPPVADVAPRALLPRGGKAREIVRFIERAGDATAADVTVALAISHQLAYHHLNALAAKGVLAKQDGHPARYRLRT